MSQGDGERPPKDEREKLLRAEMARVLRAYQSHHPDLDSISRLSAKSGIDRWTLGKIMRGTITPSERSIARLYEITQAEVFQSPDTKLTTGAGSGVSGKRQPGTDDFLKEVIRLQASVEKLRRSLTPSDTAHTERNAPPEKPSVKTRAQIVARILGELDRELAYFKEESRHDARHVLRRVVDAKDVGYLIALLKAMYDDDAFENWIFGAQYGAGSK